MDQLEISDFACPVCGSDLELRSGGILCHRCDHEFPIDDGIVDFRLKKANNNFNPIPTAELHEINRDYTPDRWSEAVRRMLALAEHKNYLFDELIVDGRYAWKVFLSLAPDQTVLDLGCGFGNLSKNLAPHIAKLYALDHPRDVLQFAKNRFAKFNSDDDITVIAAGDGARLPFRDASIDIVVSSGMLDWVGRIVDAEVSGDSKPHTSWSRLASSSSNRELRRRQLAILREVRRVLKPDGQLFASAANRFNLENFTGRKNGRPNLYGYSLIGYRHLIKQAGFNYSGFLGLHNGYSFVRNIVPVSGDFSFWAPAKARGIKSQVKGSPHLTPAYGIISSAQNLPKNRLLTAILDRVAAQLGEPAESIKVTKLQVTRKEKLIVQASQDDRQIFIKLPLNSAALAGEQNNHKRLQWLAEHRAALAQHLPRALAHGEIARQSFFAETGVAGMPLARHVDSGGKFLERFRAGLDYLHRLNPVDALEAKIVTARVYDELVVARLSLLADVVAPGQLMRLHEVFRRHLEGAELPHGLMHGDYSISNVLVSDRAVSGVMDWEESQSHGIPASDAICLMFGGARLTTQPQSIADMVCGIAMREAKFGDLLELIDEYYRTSGTKPEFHTGIVLLYWLEAMCHRLRFGMVYHQREIDNFVGGVVARLVT